MDYMVNRLAKISKLRALRVWIEGYFDAVLLPSSLLPPLLLLMYLLFSLVFLHLDIIFLFLFLFLLLPTS